MDYLCSSGGAMNSGLPVSASPLGGVAIPGVKVKFCRYYAKDKTCFYGDDCQFLHEDPAVIAQSAATANLAKKSDTVGPPGAPLDAQLLGSKLTFCVVITRCS